MAIEQLPSCKTTFSQVRSIIPNEYELFCLTDPLPDYPAQSTVKICVVASDPEEIEEYLNQAKLCPAIQELDHDRNLYIYRINLDGRLVEIQVMEGEPKETIIRSWLIELQTQYPFLIPMVLALKYSKKYSTEMAWNELLEIEVAKSNLNLLKKKAEEKIAWLNKYLNKCKEVNSNSDPY